MKPLLRPKFSGLFYDEAHPDSFWIRENGVLTLPSLTGKAHLSVVGKVLPPSDHPCSHGTVGLNIALDGTAITSQPALPPGEFRLEVPLPHKPSVNHHVLTLQLCGVGTANTLAWLGRITGLGFLQPWRIQARNRRLRILRIEVDGEILFDFSIRSSSWNTTFVRRHAQLGLNIAGFLTAELGVGESARCMVRAAEAAGLPSALIPLKLHCKNPQGDQTYAARLQTTNPHPVNVVHLDPPAAHDLEHHHPGLLTGRHNIAYWAWELPEFPDAWIPACRYFDEIWCPSDFVRDAIAIKVPLPVFTLPHAIAFEPPAGNHRAQFGLPPDKFLLLVLYDLNSYSARKNPRAAIEAFRRSGLAGKDAALVVKVHNVRGNEADLAQLRADLADLPGTVLITDTLARSAVYALQAACDCYVSLHRSEGFGLAVAECMHLGKPVIVTDWSATAEFVTAKNGCPVRYELRALERNHGPYGKGQYWAEADVDHAADWMRRLQADRLLAAEIGDAARLTIAERFAPAAIGARYRRRLESIASW